MSRFLAPIREAYDERPTLVVVCILLSLAVGCGLGYRLLGPALFG